MRNLGFCVLLLASCVCLPEQQGWEDRFRAEFDFSEIHARTPIHEIQVRFPCWLSADDHSEVLAAVDIYWDLVTKFYPQAMTFPVRDYKVWIHDAPGAFVLGNDQRQVWCHGWSIGRVWVVSWSWTYDDQGRPNGIALHDPLNALPHEMFHAIFEWERQWGDPGHRYFRDISFLLATIGMNAPLLELEADTRQDVKKYVYVPWVCPQQDAK